jgi:hypothetical protein
MTKFSWFYAKQRDDNIVVVIANISDIAFVNIIHVLMVPQNKSRQDKVFGKRKSLKGLICSL